MQKSIFLSQKKNKNTETEAKPRLGYNSSPSNKDKNRQVICYFKSRSVKRREVNKREVDEDKQWSAHTGKITSFTAHITVVCKLLVFFIIQLVCKFTIEIV